MDLFELINAAHYMDIPLLVDLGCAYLGAQCKGVCVIHANRVIV